MTNRLQDRVIIVTGVAQGLGAAIAKGMVAEGAVIAGCDIQADKGQKSVDTLGGETWFQKVDVTNGSQVTDFVAAVAERFGRVDVVVNNAAVLPPPNQSLPDTAESDWQRVLDVNLGSCFRFSSAAIPVMIKQEKGAFINLSSVHASHSIPGFAAYAASKGAILSLTRQLAVEYGKQNIRFNTISPGAIMTQMTQDILDGDPSGRLTEQFKHMHALERIGDPEEVAATAVFLASDEAGFITGEDILVDGGLTRTTRLDI